MDIQSSKTSSQSLELSNERVLLVETLREALLEPIEIAIQKAIEDLASYLDHSFDGHLLNDLISQSQASREFPLSQQRIVQLIQSKKINAYTSYRMVRRSEIKHYLATKKR